MVLDPWRGRTIDESQASARTRHYGTFYGLEALPEADDLVLVVGNCQAESLRIVLAASGVCTVRMPAVHELTASDLPHLERWLGRASALVAQPVRDDYHGLPLGTAQLAAGIPGGRVVRVPVVRFAGLFPYHALIRPPSDPSIVPPVAAYHDLRVLMEATRGARPRRVAGTPMIRAIAAASLDQLRRREAAHDAVPVSDLFASPSYEQMRTLNHPGNPVWLTVAERVLDRLGRDRVVGDPGRPLLNSIRAPRHAEVVEAWGLSDEPSADWIVEGRSIPEDEVHDAHLEWYARHPDVVEAGLARHRDTIDLLELA